MSITTKTKMCIIIGDPIEHSLSPTMHNAAYKALGIENEFVFTAAKVDVENVKDVVTAMRVMGIRGLTCTIPHKIEVIKYLDEIDETAQKIGAVNTVVNENGVLKGYNTDYLGVSIPLEQKLRITNDESTSWADTLRNKKIALIGAGGAARAMAFAVTKEGGDLTVFNRTLEKAQEITKDFGGKAKTLDEIELVKDCNIILNSTSLGMHPHENESPVPKEYLHKGQVVFDAVYVPHETKLLREAKEQGAQVVHGIEMLFYQGTAQFKIYTGHEAPEDVMRKVLFDHFKIKE